MAYFPEWSGRRNNDRWRCSVAGIRRGMITASDHSDQCSLDAFPNAMDRHAAKIHLHQRLSVAYRAVASLIESVAG